MSLRAVIGERARGDEVAVPVRPCLSPAHGQPDASDEGRVNRHQEDGCHCGRGIDEDFEVDRRVDRNRRETDEPEHGRNTVAPEATPLFLPRKVTDDRQRCVNTIPWR